MKNQKTHGIINHDLKFSPLIIIYIALAALTPYPRNARRHLKKQLDKIARSMRAFGFIVPILIDDNNVIIAGHARAEAARILGYENVPAIRIKHLTEDQRRAFIIADNRLAEEAEWDEKFLATEFQYLITVAGLDVTLTGFDTPKIDEILIEGLSSPLAEREPDPADQLPAMPDTHPISVPGDVWLAGLHRLSCDNSLKEGAFDRLMQGKKAGMVFADPPYNVPIDGHATGLGINRHRSFVMAVGEMNEVEFTTFLKQAFRLLAKHSADGAIHFLTMDWRHMSELLAAGKEVYSELKNLCIWKKDNAGMGAFYRSQHELVFVFKHGKCRHKNNFELGQHGRYRTNVWEYAGANSFSRQSDEGNLLALHPTVKPVAMVADAIMDCSDRGDIVLDSFLGSGSTLIAAERVGRVCYGMEIDPLYVDTAIRRWQAFTGKQAVHAVSGKPFEEVEAAHV